MDFKNGLKLFSFKRGMTLMRQTRDAECGVVSLLMIYEFLTGISSSEKIREIRKCGHQGMTLLGLMKCAQFLDLTARPVKINAQNIKKLRLPAIVHWQGNHFVVLVKVSNKGLFINDPAKGSLVVSWEELKTYPMEYALEIWLEKPISDVGDRSKVTLLAFTKNLHGKFSALLLLLSISFSLELVVLVQPMLLQLALDKFIPSEDMGLILVFGIGFAFLVLVQQAVRAFKEWILVYWGVLINVQCRSNLFRHILKLPADFFGRHPTGDIVSRFGAIDPIQNAVTTSIAGLIIDALISLVVLCLMVYYHGSLAFITAACISLYLLVRFAWYRPLKNNEVSKNKAAAIQHGFFLESIRGIRTVQLFSRESARHMEWLRLVSTQIKSDVGIKKLHMFYHFSIGLILGLENILIISLGCVAVINGTLSAGQLIAFIAYKNILGARMGSFINSCFELKLLCVPLDRVSQLLIEDPIASRPLEWMIKNPPILELKDVSFSYSIDESKILNCVNVRIAPGEFVVFVGASGAGKTTMLSLILGLRAPDSGEVLLNDKSLWQKNSLNLRGVFASVLQDDILFSGTLMENISFFDERVDVTHAKDCAKLAAIHSDIESMPMQYDTVLGEAGLCLSGGQRQRVMLARALYSRPKILVLDEATSHLDIENERHIATALRKLAITRVVVAHRYETISLADRVIDISQFSRIKNAHV